MKLLLCKSCQDIIRLVYLKRTCQCGAISGKAMDLINAIYSGDHAVPLGFANNTLVRAVTNQPIEGLGREFVAFVIPKKCDSFIKVDEVK